MIWTGIALTAVSYTALSMAWIYASVPHSGEGGWGNPKYFLRVERDTPPISIGLGAVGTFTDFFTLLIPLLAIMDLNMSTKKKLGVSALFATGSL
jgi:hypothetical protein